MPADTLHYSPSRHRSRVAKREHGPSSDSARADGVGTASGVSLILDIGLMDTTTCEALPNTLVEVWARA